MSVNKVILIGRLGQNPEVKFTPSGAAVANFSVATNESWTDKNGQKQEKTEWHRIVVWGKLAELCGQYLTKGRQAYIEGRLQTRQWQDKDGQTKYTTEVQAQTVQFIGGASQGQSAGQTDFDQSAYSGASSGGGQYSKAATPQFGTSFGGNFGQSSVPTPQMTPESGFTEDDIPF